MPSYLVTWGINIDADSPREAAEKARAYQLNPEAWVGIFDVAADDGKGVSTQVDLDEPAEAGPPNSCAKCGVALGDARVTDGGFSYCSQRCFERH